MAGVGDIRQKQMENGYCSCWSLLAGNMTKAYYTTTNNFLVLPRLADIDIQTSQTKPHEKSVLGRTILTNTALHNKSFPLSPMPIQLPTKSMRSLTEFISTRAFKKGEYRDGLKRNIDKTERIDWVHGSQVSPWCCSSETEDFMYIPTYILCLELWNCAF